jgi:hypothetical protein
MANTLSKKKSMANTLSKKEINGKYKVDKKEYPAKLRIDDSLS